MNKQPLTIISLLIVAVTLAGAAHWLPGVRAQERPGPGEPTAGEEASLPLQQDFNAPAADCTADDSFEDNDTPGAAAPVTPGTYTSLVLCYDDFNDFFAVEVPAGHTLHAELTFAHSGGNIDLLLLRQDGTTAVNVSSSSSDDEAARMTVAEEGTYYVLAEYSLLASGSNSYNLRLHLSCDDCISYQGQLRDGGIPANGSYQFQFALYDAAGTVGLRLAGPITRTVPVSNGLFTADLYFGDTVAAYNGADFSSSRFLEVRARPAGSGTSFTTLSPRQPLTPAPVAHTLRPGSIISDTSPNSDGALNLYSRQGAGLYVQESGRAGLHVSSAGYEGVYVNSAGGYGLGVGVAGSDGVYVGSAGGNGLNVVSASADGVAVYDAENDGVAVVSAAGDGFNICATGDEVCVSGTGSPYNHGVEIGRAQNDGVHVIQAGGDGLQVCATGTQSDCTGNSYDHGVEVGNSEHDGLHITNAGSDGLDVENAGADGVKVRSANNWAGNFQGSVNITGSCNGCNVTTMAVNSSSTTLAPGDLVGSTGALDGVGVGQPLLLEAVPAVAGQGVVGVVEGRAELVEETRHDGTVETQLIPRQGPAAPGEYVAVVIYGPVQVRAGAALLAADDHLAGQRLAVATDGVRPLQTTTVDGLTVAEEVPTVGLALEAKPNAEGLLWVLVNPQ